MSKPAAALLAAAATLAGGCGGGGGGWAQVSKTDPGGAQAVNAYRAALAGGAATTPSTATPQATPSTPPTAAGRPPAPAHPIPVSFGPAAGAPSDAEVRAELTQLKRYQNSQQALLAKFSPAAATFADLLPWQDEPKLNQVSIASVFTDYGLGIACGGVLGRDQIGVAHKTAPCGTIIDFIYGNRELKVPVIDRGPYIAGREWDLTGAAAAALQFPGLGPIRWSVVS